MPSYVPAPVFAGLCRRLLIRRWNDGIEDFRALQRSRVTSCAWTASGHRLPARSLIQIECAPASLATVFTVSENH